MNMPRSGVFANRPSSLRIRLLLLYCTVFFGAISENFATARAEYADDLVYSYMSATNVNYVYHIRLSHDRNFFFYRDTTMDVEVSADRSKEYIYFLASGSPWLQFALPSDWPSEKTEWIFRGCDYAVVDETHYFYESRDGASKKVAVHLIQNKCSDHPIRTRFLYDSHRGLVAFSVGDVKSVDGQEEFSEGGTNLLFGSYFGFGSGRDD